MKRDKYSKARGGWSRLLDIRCKKCEAHVCYYQKDGPGLLKRMYVDRMLCADSFGKELVCSGCSSILGVWVIYKKENRPAFRLFVGSIKKSIVKSSVI